MSNTIVKQTDAAREVIPILTPENYKDVHARFGERPIPDHLRNPNALNGDGLGRLELDTVTNADGEPTNWLVSIKDDKMWLTGRLSCSFPNCAGHSDGDIEETWAEMSHQVAEVDLRAKVDLGITDRHEASAEIVVRDEGTVVSYYLNIEGVMPFADVPKLAGYFSWVGRQLLSMTVPESEQSN